MKPKIGMRTGDLLYNKEDKLEIDTIEDTGIKNISGGFAKAEMFNHDDKYADIELKWGIQNDIQNDVHVEQYKLNLINFEIEDV